MIREARGLSLLSNRVKNYWVNWVKKRSGDGHQQTLNSKNLYILPSSFGWIYALVVIILFLIGINYQINTIFLMAFILITIGFLSAFESHANLKNLSFTLIAIEDAQEGTPAKIKFYIEPNKKIRFGIEFKVSQTITRLEELPHEGLHFTIPIETPKRGYFLLSPITISSQFPFGLFRVWGYANFAAHYYVYPQPKLLTHWPEPYLEKDIKKAYRLGDEEYYDLKQAAHPWTEPNLIAWKIAAKGLGWYHKKMASNTADYWLFTLNDIPVKEVELKLQHLSYLVQTAEANGLIYGLKLDKSSDVTFSHGKVHLQQCLRQLALYP